jgi:hypothetical protein
MTTTNMLTQDTPVFGSVPVCDFAFARSLALVGVMEEIRIFEEKTKLFSTTLAGELYTATRRDICRTLAFLRQQKQELEDSFGHTDSEEEVWEDLPELEEDSLRFGDFIPGIYHPIYDPI